MEYKQITLKDNSTSEVLMPFTTENEVLMTDNTTLKSALNNKQDKLTAGTNITISTDNVISATGGGGGSSVTIADDPDGGVDLTVDGTTKVLSKQSDIVDIKGRLDTDETEITDIWGSLSYLDPVEMSDNVSGGVDVSVGKDEVKITRTLAKESDLSTKQDKLTAGTNITIENNVISATGGGGSFDYPSAVVNTEVTALDTTSKTVAGAINELNGIVNPPPSERYVEEVSSFEFKIHIPEGIVDVLISTSDGDLTYTTNYGTRSCTRANVQGDMPILMLSASYDNVWGGAGWFTLNTDYINNRFTNTTYGDQVLATTFIKDDITLYCYHQSGGIRLSENPTVTVKIGEYQTNISKTYAFNPTIYSEESKEFVVSTLITRLLNADPSSQYATKGYVDDAVSTKQNTLIAGTNITIDSTTSTINAIINQLPSSNVQYDGSGTELTSTNVQSVVTELYQLISSLTTRISTLESELNGVTEQVDQINGEII